jgi:hypothetical protein
MNNDADKKTGSMMAPVVVEAVATQSEIGNFEILLSIEIVGQKLKVSLSNVDARKTICTKFQCPVYNVSETVSVQIYTLSLVYSNVLDYFDRTKRKSRGVL